MFGVSRKKNKPSTARVRATSSSDDDEDDGARLRLQKHQELRKANKMKKKKGDKKKKNAPMLSFDPEEAGGDDNEDDGFGPSSKKSKKRKKHSSKHGKSKKSSGGGGGGLGYGGLGSMAMNASDESASDGDNNNKEDGDVGGSYYDADALEKLKKEQKRTVLTKDDTADKSVEPEKPAAGENDSKTVRKERDDKKGGADEEEFISLSGGSKSKHVDPVVLTGDEALAYAQRDEDENNATMEFDHGLQSPPTPPPQHETSMSNKIAEMDINNNVSDKMDIDNEPPSEEVEEGNRRWEDTMARRAGVLPPDAARTGNGNKQQQSRARQSHEQNTSSSSSLSQMRASLQPTITNLSNINSDLESSIHRHQSKLSSTHEEFTKHRLTLQKHGQALEYYQGLREDLATWMGALRELNGMIEKVELAKGKIEHEMTCTRMERFWEWGNDCTEVLERQGLLKTKVVGDGAGNSAIVEQIRQVDEFGRDLSSMSSMARVKRWNQRRKRCAKRMQQNHVDNKNNPLQQRMECSNEDNINPAEMEEWKSRYDALQQAIGIIPNLVDDNYLSITNLCTLFNDWEQLYPDDYKNCYAELSLVQMISVLVRMELCQKWDVLGLHYTPSSSSSGGCLDVTEFKWFGDLQKFNAQREATNAVEVEKATTQTEPRKSLLLEVVQKQVINHFMDTLSFQDGNGTVSKKELHGAYDPSSSTQTKQMCSTLQSILRYFSNHANENGRDVCAETLGKVTDALLLSLKHYIGKMTVPVVDALKVSVIQDDFVARDGAKDFDDEASDAIAYATLIQAKELCKLVKIVLEHWYPTINQELHNTQKEGVSSLVKFVYEDLINSHILPTLHSLCDISSGQGEKYSEMPKVLISDIMDALQGADLLEKDEWMLIAAPLRVASQQLG